MAKKKSKQQLASPDGGPANGGPVSASPSPSPAKAAAPLEKTSSGSSSSSRARAGTAAAQQPPSPPALIICRNKHWRYISSFHGPWLQLPPDILETLANINYNAPRPRPVDPAVFFDLVKIRRHVDEATNLAVRAASGVASPALSGFGGGGGPLQHGLGFGPAGGGGHLKLSKERRHRMREQATQKLSRAYRLDEIACSVATMQSASSLEEVASLVLQRSPADPDAKYVHFFHEKIPSRQLAESTSLAPLNDIIADRPNDGEPLRTRATVRVFKADFEGAAADLTSALQVLRLYRPHAGEAAAAVAAAAAAQESQQQVQRYERRSRRQEVTLDEDQQPSGLEIQLLFQRAGVYLTMACRHVNEALTDARPSKDGAAEQATNGDETAAGAAPDAAPELSTAEQEAHRHALEMRKTVKANAKKALRDYMAYLSHFDYSPDLPVEIPEDFTRRVSAVANHTRAGHRGQHPGPDSPAADVSYRVYALSELFSATPPAALPPYPSTELTAPAPRPSSSAPPGEAEPSPAATTEMVTYHPLLTDALHALLLCHALVQTSAKELLRHAYMVARLARLTDGYPVFQSSRSPARADWIEILRRCDNWIQLAGGWEGLCAPAPLPLSGVQHGAGANNNTTPRGAAGGPAKAALPPPATAAPSEGGASSALVKAPDAPGAAAVACRQRQDDEADLAAALRRRVILEALEDERVHDEASLRASILARQRRAEDDLRQEQEQEQQRNAGATGGARARPPHTSGTDVVSASNGIGAAPAPAPLPAAVERAVPPAASAPRRWAADDGREYPILTDRAAAVARWVREAPLVGSAGGTGGKRRKRPAAGRKAAAATEAAGAGGGDALRRASEADPGARGTGGDADGTRDRA